MRLGNKLHGMLHQISQSHGFNNVAVVEFFSQSPYANDVGEIREEFMHLLAKPLVGSCFGNNPDNLDKLREPADQVALCFFHSS